MKEDACAYLLAKWYLNSLWGYCCQRMDRPVSFIVSNDLAFLQLLRDKQENYTLCDVHQLSSRRLLVKMKPRVPEMNRKGNVILGSATTSLGQLYLLDGLLQVAEQVSLNVCAQIKI